jgi:inorganic pyrophosphatase
MTQIDEPPVELCVEIPGGLHARYEYDFRHAALRVAEVVYPAERAPADRCAVADKLTGDQAPLAAFLLGNTSLPTGARVWARPVGIIAVSEDDRSGPYLVAVAADDPHFAGVAEPADLSFERRRNLELFLSGE